jgi:hypothetical protein
LLDESKTRNFEKWPVLGVWIWPNYYVGQTYTDEINYLKNWISSRINWMNNNMIGEPTSVNRNNDFLPDRFSLSQNCPNPFNPSTRIKYQVSRISQVSLKVFDVLGNEIATLVNEEKPAGSYEVEFYVSNLAGGIYFYRMNVHDFVYTKKMILLK